MREKECVKAVCVRSSRIFFAMRSQIADNAGGPLGFMNWSNVQPDSDLENSPFCVRVPAILRLSFSFLVLFFFFWKERWNIIGDLLTVFGRL